MDEGGGVHQRAVDLAARVPAEQHRCYGIHEDYEAIQKARQEAEDAFFSIQEAFSRAAAAALAAAEVPVTRLALCVDSDGHDSELEMFLHGSRDGKWSTDVVGAVLSHRAARHVEELRVALFDGFDARLFSGTEVQRVTGTCRLASMPSTSILRVLDLTRCECDLALAASFPRLVTLRLRLCSVAPKDLQAILDAAPELTDVHLESVRFTYYNGEDGDHDGKEVTRVLFWQFVQSFASVRALNLKVDDELKDVAAIGKARRAQLLCPLPNVERLELEGWHRPTSTTATVAIANLLHCCPALRDLTLNLSVVQPDSRKRSSYGGAILKRKDRLGYSRSIDRFRHRSSKRTTSMEDSNGVRYHDVQGIPGLSGHSFGCLQRSLRRVSLQFRLGDSSSSCLGLRLVKFFAENAMVLEEMRIDSGNWRLYEHLNLSVQRWIAPNNTTKACYVHENLVAEGQCEFSRIPSVSLDSTTDLGSTIGFIVLPLQIRRIE
ncbi:hypothetical protein HU200_024792 [Digitaria exilis]|uniref:FBD domain-containing protein n=1 Tax=Digitaria exilis TaxID=1010633 RepID=A0A835EWA9_9POAL|nr:hypothetical protein HU200_024792 [Digitaria exilis]